MLPTLRQLQYLTQLAQHGTFSRAAEAAHVTQPTLSAGIQELERTLGAAVVDRARGGVILTPAGVEAVARARDILTAAEDLVEACRDAAEPLSGRLRLGVIPTIAPFLLPRALADVRTRHPKLRVFLREDLTQRLIADLKAGLLDMVLIALPYDTTGLETAHVRDDEILAALPADHPLAQAVRMPVEEMARQEVILLEGGHCLRDHAIAACHWEGRSPQTQASFAATSLGTLMQMVSSGLGVSLIPALAVESGLAEASRVAVRALDPAQPGRQIVIAWRQGSSRGAEARVLADLFRAAMAAPAHQSVAA